MKKTAGKTQIKALSNPTLFYKESFGKISPTKTISMKKFYGKLKVNGVNITISSDRIMIFDTENEVEKENGFKICEYLIDEGFFNKEDLIKVDIVRPINRE